MIEIKTVEDFNTKVKDFRKENGRALTNCFLMPGEITELSSAGKLFMQELPGWLVILCDRDDYMNFYYYTTEDSDASYIKEFIGKNGEKEIYMDVVSRMGRGDFLTAQRLSESGAAEKYKVYQRMQLPVSDIRADELSDSMSEGYILCEDYCDENALNELWKVSLDEKSTPLPKKDELEKICQDGHLYAVLDKKGNLAAVSLLNVSAKQGLIQHVAVSPVHRRKGLAASLMKKSLLDAKEDGLTMLRLWVDCENTAAIALYNRFNFQKDGMLCDQLYMKGF